MKPDETVPEVPTKTAENPPTEPEKLKDRQLAYTLLRKQGMSVEMASKAVGYHERYGYELEKKLKGHDLTSEYWLSKASKALKNILEGKTFGEIKEIKASTALEASKMVYDRAQPVIRRQENLNISADLGFVDLSKYRIRYPEEDTSQKASPEGT